MRKNSTETTGRRPVAGHWAARIAGLPKILGALLLLALLHSPSQAFSVTLPSLYTVGLGWNASSDPGITGYRIYSGTTSGNYTASIAVGNVTTNLVTGLSSGVTYYFAVTAIGATGLESGLSSEVSYQPGLPTVQLRAAANGQIILTLGGQVGSTYNIQASTDLISWTNIGTGLLPVGGVLDFVDPNAANFPQRFYRMQ